MDGIESNPGLTVYSLENVVQGNYLKGSKKDVETAGAQCTNNDYLVICYSATKILLDWMAFDFDYILDQGDFFMKSLANTHAFIIFKR